MYPAVALRSTPNTLPRMAVRTGHILLECVPVWCSQAETVVNLLSELFQSYRNFPRPKTACGLGYNGKASTHVGIPGR